MAKLLFGDGRSDKGNCTAGRVESHGYQGLPKGSVRKGYLRNQGVVGRTARDRLYKKDGDLLPRGGGRDARRTVAGTAALRSPSTNGLCGEGGKKGYSSDARLDGCVAAEAAPFQTRAHTRKRENRDDDVDPNRTDVGGRREAAAGYRGAEGDVSQGVF